VARHDTAATVGDSGRRRTVTIAVPGNSGTNDILTSETEVEDWDGILDPHG